MSLRELNWWLAECPELRHDRAALLGLAWTAWRRNQKSSNDLSRRAA